jgi:hypothetical protein
MVRFFFFFFFPLDRVPSHEDHPKEYLAKFVYKPDMKVKEFNDPFYILGYPLEPIVKKSDEKFGNFFS